jgi:hypothetical protein
VVKSGWIIFIKKSFGLKVSVIIINYNTFQLTCGCISSVIAFTKGVNYEIILVDNASTECDPKDFTERFPQITCVRNPNNDGFAGGNNLGISHATGDIILLLNSDTYLTEDSIGIMANNITADTKIGVACCRMIYPDGGLQFAARRFRSISWELLDIFRFILLLLPYKKRAQLMLGKYFKNDFDTGCDWVSGAFFMFRRNVIDQLPGKKLDDRFFMYGEDHLWCWQIKQLGYTNWFFSNTTIVHINNGSTSIGKQLALRKTMLAHELVIMKERKGSGMYYLLFSFIYSAKENGRNAIKYLWMKMTGKMIR